ncbi:phosphoglycerate dehydrogenase [Sediminivirga luteola]|uniref:Oxidoreductase n=2 Tax=Sediminivirga luteola TaxID=1774748 RepID=A0A8J2U0U6_9MICO|nr:phosphoglycerate dehydrogenase [Sediminivirga luteola]MCI2264906.1 phosphoglycerate dehydrogenase [Sediminivirga luteola]GGA26349.1 oxidoreductase [Sediminivirga luteola]
MRILVTSTSLCRTPEAPALQRLRAAGHEVVLSTAGRPLDGEELIRALRDVDGVIAGVDSYTREVIEASGSLRVISRYGVGTDKIDLAAARERQVAVTVTPGANATAVAELAIGLAFAVARGIPQLDAQVRAGGWPRGQGVELSGRRLGVIGLGAIGRKVAAMGAGLGMTVHGSDPNVPQQTLRAAGIVPGDLDEVVAAADVLSLHIPLTPQTRHLIGAGRIKAMPAGAIIVNTARGGLIDEDAALAALDSGRLHGIGLDAYEVEPPVDSPLVGHPRVVSTPHSGAHTAEAVERMAEGAVTNLLQVLAGEDCPNLVTGG